MRMDVLSDPDSVAREAATIIANEARIAVSTRGSFVLAVSGGRTPWIMLQLLAKEDIPWEGMHIVQVDERVAPEGHPDRNLTHLRESLKLAPLRPEQIHSMEVNAVDLQEATRRYSDVLSKIAGSPPVLDLVHLGLGPDGHTASLVPGDPVLNVSDSDVAITGSYQGRQRMTLTYPIINRSRNILWLVTGHEKAAMLTRLCNGDASIPAGHVQRDAATILADRAAADYIPDQTIP
ncbi:MAG: 6-phosphogluconolactonase [Schlesneria sp.]|nr:6-phosphogluconolactonase [Schlesneria sp.]